MPAIVSCPRLAGKPWGEKQMSTATLAVREEDFTGAGGLRIHYRSWLPEGAPRAVVAICHGVNSHSGQHAWTAETLAGRGFAVYAVDLRGRGKSEGERFYVDDDLGKEEVMADILGWIEARLPARS